jgi:competence protein ComEC
MRAHLINVGQGAATLFEFSCGVVLVDAGGESSGEFDSDRALSTYLEDFFDGRPELDRTIELLVITHPHIDHVRGAELVTRDFHVRNVVTNGLLENAGGHFHSGGRRQGALEQWARANAKLETIETSEIPKGGKTDAIIDPVQCTDEDPTLRVLWGHQTQQPDDWTAEAFDDANNHSVAVRVDFGTSSFLVTGDLELEAVPAVVAKHEGSDALDVDVWQVSHHGSANGTGKAILDAVTPQIALLGTGDPELSHSKFSAFAFGHPRATVVSQLLEHLSRRRSATDVTVATGVKTFKAVNLREAIYATGWDGSVVVTADNDGKYRVLTDR